MLYIVAIFLGITGGIIAKGKVSNLLNLKFEKAWIIILAFIIQTAAQVMSLNGFEFVIKYSFVIYASVFLLLLFGFWFNRHYFGVCVIGAGCFLNACVMLLNGGKMPVSYETLVKAGLAHMAQMLENGADGKHMLINESTKLAFFSDTIHPPGILSLMMQVVSIGDIIIVFGVFFIIFEVIIDKKGLNLISGGLKNEKAD